MIKFRRSQVIFFLVLLLSIGFNLYFCYHFYYNSGKTVAEADVKPKFSPEDVVKKYVILKSYEEFKEQYGLLSNRWQSNYQSASDYAKMRKGLIGSKWPVKLVSIDLIDVVKKKAKIRATLSLSKNGKKEERKTTFFLIFEDNNWKIDYIRDLKNINDLLDGIVSSMASSLGIFKSEPDIIKLNADIIKHARERLRKDSGFTDDEINNLLEPRRKIYQRNKKFRDNTEKFEKSLEEFEKFLKKKSD